MQLKSDEISKIIKDQIKNYSNKIEQKETGYVVEVGDGMEGIFNDAKVGRMIDNLALPYFAENNFDTGIKNLYTGIIEVIGNPAAFEDDEADVGEIAGTIALVLVLILLSVLTGGRGGGRWRWGGYVGRGGFGGGYSGGGFGGFGGGGSRRF